WLSMIPGIATRPVASMIVTSLGTSRSVPIAAILPSRTRIDPLGIVPSLATVRMVAFLIKTDPPVLIFGLRVASHSVATTRDEGFEVLSSIVFAASGVVGAVLVLD